MKKQMCAILLVLCVALSPVAGAMTKGSPVKGPAPKNKTYALLNANNWQIYTTNYGPFVFPRNSTAGGSWGGPGYTYIYGAGLWVGALDTAGAPHVTVGYNPNNGGSEFGPIDPFTGDTAKWATNALARVYLSTNPPDLANWPLRDSLGNPIVKSVQDGYAAYNDINPAFTNTGDLPVGVRVDQSSYAWNFAQLNDVVFFRTVIRNLTADTMKNMYIGPCIDADIGNESGTSANDLVMFDQPRNMAIQYQLVTEPGWPNGGATGKFGCRFFESPRNNTGAPITVVDDSFGHTILPDSMLGMTAFKIFNIAIDPVTDADRYKEMRGIDYKTDLMDAYDVDNYGPSDKRFLMTSGPFNLAPGDSAASCVCAMAAWDTAALRTLSDYAQIIYDHGFASLPVTITSPNGGEVVSGTTNITWNCVAPACSVSIFYSRDEGLTWVKVADSLANSGSYSWSTTALTDGVRYKVRLFAHSPSGIGGDESDACFTVNNAADAHPEVAVIAPQYGESWSGGQYFKYHYGHADNDLCRIQFRLKGPAGTWDSLTTVDRTSQVWTRDSLPWSTRTVPNYPYYLLRLKAVDHDPADSAIVMSDTFAVDNAYPDVGSLQHATGGSDAVIVNPYVWSEPQLTGHQYQFRFKNITRGGQAAGIYQPWYSYDLWDVDLNSAVLSNQGKSVTMDDSWQWDVPSPVDGFIPEVRYRQYSGSSTADSAKVTTEAGAVSSDTLYPDGTLTSQKWMSYGTDFEVRWHVHGVYPNDTLTAEVWDLDNNLAVPLDTLGYNNLLQSAWSFGPTATVSGRSFITSAWPIASRSYLFVCGARFWFNRSVTLHAMTWATHPAEGEVWTLYTSGYKPPRQGDVFSFMGVNGVEGKPGTVGGTFAVFQNAPNPFAGATTLRYQLTGPADVSLKVYNITGQLVSTLVAARQSAGPHSVQWDGRSAAGQKLSAGVYVYRLQAGDKTMTKKLVLVR